MEEILSSIRRIIADEETEEGEVGADKEASIEPAQEDALSLDSLEILDDDDDDDDDSSDVLELTSAVDQTDDDDEIVVEPLASSPIELVDEEEEEADIELADIDELPSVANLPDDDLEDEPIVAFENAPSPQDDGFDSANLVDTTISQEDVPAVSTKKVETEALLSTGTASTTTGAFAKLSKAFRPTPVEESVADGAGRTVEQFIEDMARPMLKEWLDENMPAIVERLVQKEIQKIARRAELL
jgi:cell pole-organizing protein PopZ